MQRLNKMCCVCGQRKNNMRRHANSHNMKKINLSDFWCDRCRSQQDAHLFVEVRKTLPQKIPQPSQLLLLVFYCKPNNTFNSRHSFWDELGIVWGKACSPSCSLFIFFPSLLCQKTPTYPQQPMLQLLISWYECFSSFGRRTVTISTP